VKKEIPINVILIAKREKEKTDHKMITKHKLEEIGKKLK
jgi:hypothetical protein